MRILIYLMIIYLGIAAYGGSTILGLLGWGMVLFLYHNIEDDDINSKGT